MKRTIAVLDVVSNAYFPVAAAVELGFFQVEEIGHARIAPLDEGPLSAVRLFMGDPGTLDGLRTTAVRQVLSGPGTVAEDRCAGNALDPPCRLVHH